MSGINFGPCDDSWAIVICNSQLLCHDLDDGSQRALGQSNGLRLAIYCHWRNWDQNVAGSWVTAASPTTWSTASTWEAGAVHEASTSVTISQDQTLDVDVSVSGLTISSGATLTASDVSVRTLTIASGGSVVTMAPSPHPRAKWLLREQEV